MGKCKIKCKKPAKEDFTEPNAFDINLVLSALLTLIWDYLVTRLVKYAKGAREKELALFANFIG